MPSAPNEQENLPDAGSPDSRPREAADYRPILNEMLSLGAELSRLIVQRAAAEPPTPVAEAAIAFDRVSRGMRRTILLLRHLDEPAKPSATHHRVTARKRILRDVEDAIDIAFDDRSRPLPEPEKAELRLELLDRLDSPDTEDDITGRPVEDIVNEICRDLRVRHQDTSQRGRRRTPADIEALNALAAKPRGEPAASVARKDSSPRQAPEGDPDDMAELLALHDFILKSGTPSRAGPW